MAGVNGYHRDDYPTLKQKLREARARQRLARLEAETQLLEGFGAEPGLGFPTSWFDPFDLARFGWGVGGQAAGGAWNAGSRAARQDGGNHPFFWTETDLERSRGLARWLATRNLWATATLNDLTNYAIKLGFTYEAQPKKRWATDEVVKELALLVQDVVDNFAEQNRAPQVEREAFWWSRPDGECIYRFFDQRDGGTLIRPVLPEQLRQPLGSPPECSYGIETDPHDILSLRAFYVDYHGNSPDQYAHGDFDEIPADEIAYLKLNVHSTVKRGLSDFFCCAPAFDELDKLLHNMRITAGVQSAVAHYERFTNLTSDALADFKARRKDLNRPQIQHPISGRTLDMEHHEAGQVRLINGNREFIPPPLAQNTTNHISILQAATRTLGRRWSMPEYMASGDASNANYSSTLVAGSPFVNEMECEQDRYRTYFLDWRWIAVRNAARAGVFTLGGRRFTFEEIRRLVDLHATPPQVAIANKQAEAAVDHQDLAARVTSLQALRAKRGYDNDKIRQDLAEEPPTAVAGRVTDVDPMGNPLGGGGGRPVAGAGPIQVRRGGKTFLRRRVHESRVLLEAGFTGVIKDSLGRERHYENGKQIKGPEEGKELPPEAHTGSGAKGKKKKSKDKDKEEKTPEQLETIAAKREKLAESFQEKADLHGEQAVRQFDVALQSLPEDQKELRNLVTQARRAALTGSHIQGFQLAQQAFRHAALEAGPLPAPVTGNLSGAIGAMNQARDATRDSQGWKAAALRARQKARELSRQQPVRESLLEGFTGTVTDKLGRVRHYVDGKQVKGPSLEHGYSREEIHAMSPAQRKSLLGLVAGISPKGKTDEEIRDILSPPEKAAPAAQGPPAAPAPESKLPPAEHKAALNDLLAAKQKGEAEGGFDPRGDLAHLPPPEKTAAVRSDVLAIVGEHTRRTTVGIAVNRLYDQLSQKHDLSPEEFRAVLLDASRAGEVRPGLWPRMVSDLPRPDLAPLISAEVVGYVHLPSA
jgi:hypothetical protein